MINPRRIFDGLLALAFAFPMLGWLAAFPLSPDGAEMLNTAYSGGVMHPSGMPLQAWLNRFILMGSAGAEAWRLSLLSWSAHALSGYVLLSILRLMDVGLVVRLLALLLFFYFHPLWQLALQPEKYTLLVLTMLICIRACLRSSLVVVGLALGVAVSQHPAALVVVPLILILRPLNLRELGKAGGALLLTAVPAYLSLLWLRTESPWPDWGALRTAHDVWWHFLRRDYGMWSLYPAGAPSGETVSGWDGLLVSLSALWPAVVVMAVGAVGIQNRRLALAWLGSLAAALYLLFISRLPSFDLATATAYTERYQVVAWPFLVTLFALGLSWFAGRLPLLVRWPVYSCVGVVLALYANSGRAVVENIGQNNFYEVYRAQLAREMPKGALFVSASDFELFSGIPCGEKVCFPLQGLFAFEWYRKQTAPALDHRVPGILKALSPPWTYVDFVREALAQGMVVATTSVAPFMPHPEIMLQAEQTGLLWVLAKGQSAQHTNKILAHAVELCQSFSALRASVPANGLYFLHDPLSNMRFAFNGAAIFLHEEENPSARAAEEVAKSLVPGTSPKEWKTACEKFQTSLAAHAP